MSKARMSDTLPTMGARCTRCHYVVAFTVRDDGMMAERARLLDYAAAEHLDRCLGPVERYETKGGEE
jgi:hypothetical protein